jgi:hypothetical protein
MSQSNITNENSSPSISRKKPLAFVQPVIRGLQSDSPSSQRMNQNQVEKPSLLLCENSLSYVSQPRKLPMDKRTDFNDHEK